MSKYKGHFDGLAANHDWPVFCDQAGGLIKGKSEAPVGLPFSALRLTLQAIRFAMY